MGTVCPVVWFSLDTTVFPASLPCADVTYTLNCASALEGCNLPVDGLAAPTEDDPYRKI